MGLLISLWIVISFPVDKYPEMESLDHMVALFLKFLGNLHTYFYSGCPSLHSHKHCMGISFCPQLPQHLLSYMFFILLYLGGIPFTLLNRFYVFLTASSLISSSISEGYAVSSWSANHLHRKFVDKSWIFCKSFINFSYYWQRKTELSSSFHTYQSTKFILFVQFVPTSSKLQ